MKYFLSIFSLAFLMFSCSHPDDKPEVPAQFGRFKPVQLPLEIKACNMHQPGLSDMQVDTMESEDGFIPYCFFEGPGTFKTCISIGIADCSMPLLSIYTSDGKKVDEKFLGGGNCDGSTEMICKPCVTIKKDLSIVICDSITVSPMDSCGNELNGPKTRYIITREGRIKPDGKIELGEAKRKDN
jgi:hypothetical protein